MALKIEKFEGSKASNTDTNEFWKTVGKLKVGERVFFPKKTMDRGYVAVGVQALREVCGITLRTGTENGSLFVYRV